MEKLAELGEVTIDAFLPPNYPEAKLWRNVLGLDSSYQFSTRTFSATLSRLRHQGLVARHGNNRSGYWSLTRRGEDTIREIVLLPPIDHIPRLVIFDIPEFERNKRAAIRQDLLAYEFCPLQKSVWIGYRPLPADFFELIDTLRIRKHVHVVSIRETGTLGDL